MIFVISCCALLSSIQNFEHTLHTSFNDVLCESCTMLLLLVLATITPFIAIKKEALGARHFSAPTRAQHADIRFLL